MLAHVAEHPRLRILIVDLLDRDDMVAAFDGVSTVFHLAANADVRLAAVDQEIDLRQGVESTANALHAAVKVNASRFIFASSSTVYGEATAIPTPEEYGPLHPISLYGAAKLGAEGFVTAYAHSFGLRCWIYRFANVIGPRVTHGVIVDFLEKLRRDRTRLEILGDGRQAKSYLTVRDCVDGILHGLDHATDHVNLYNLGTDDVITVRRIAEIVIEELGIQNVRLEFTGGDRGWKGDVPRMHLSCTRLKNLGWKPSHSSEEAVREAIRSLRAERWQP